MTHGFVLHGSTLMPPEKADRAFLSVEVSRACTDDDASIQDSDVATCLHREEFAYLLWLSLVYLVAMS